VGEWVAFLKEYGEVSGNLKVYFDFWGSLEWARDLA
jgi:hypothetical protein